VNREQLLVRGRESLAARAWSEAFEALSAADREAALEPAELERLVGVAMVIGRAAEATELLTRVHQGYVSRGDTRGATRTASWLAFQYHLRGDRAQGNGWLARAERLAESLDPDQVERGYVLLPKALRAAREGDAQASLRNFAGAEAIASRLGDRELLVLALNGQGRALIQSGEVPRGTAKLDEAMVAVTAGEVSPALAGAVYCSVLEGCAEVLDVRRATEWTAALDQWCSTQPDLIPFQGHCYLHRAELLQLQGAWDTALEAATLAAQRLSRPAPGPAACAAFCRVAEIHRLRGDLARAEEAFAEANRCGRPAHPGIALLELARGRTDSAWSAIRRLRDEVREQGPRVLVLAACVEIALAAGEVPAARAAADELCDLAARLDAPWPHALCAEASGAVLVAEGEDALGLVALRRAFRTWQRLGAPYDAARARERIGLALERRNETRAARAELDAARGTFESLRAAADAARVAAHLRADDSGDEGPLSEREAEVVRLVATGLANKEIASRLGISEKTVARHLNNIFNKLDLPSRSALTAWAFRHDRV
jgi:ATP/maltotriose-dependent transcriptional regulator MalT